MQWDLTFTEMAGRTEYISSVVKDALPLPAAVGPSTLGSVGHSRWLTVAQNSPELLPTHNVVETTKQEKHHHLESPLVGMNKHVPKTEIQ